MSQVQVAFIEKGKIPDRDALQASVRGLGFDLEIDDFYQPHECSGYLPCKLRGTLSGFEICFESADESLEEFPHRKEIVGPRDNAIVFRWGGDMAECACVLIVSAALAKDFGAVIHYQDDDLVSSVEDILKEARACLADIDSSPKKAAPITRAPGLPKKP